MHLLVRRAGFLTTVQDLGRAGFRASGVSIGGALDPHALRTANLLVGNDENAAGLEMTLGTAHFELADERLIAWCGGAFQVRVGNDEIPPGRVARVNPGEELQLVAPPEGARAWLAISGGVDVPQVLGSRSTDLRSGFGGLEARALRDADVLKLRSTVTAVYDRRNGPDLQTRDSAVIARRGSQRLASWFAPNEWVKTRSNRAFLRVTRGGEWSEFEGAAFLREAFIVTPDSDRMGVRLEGTALKRNTDRELLSEAVAPGTIQVPPNGEPILLLGDCQTIGGYPKIAHVISVDLPAAAQLRPADEVRFLEMSLGEAQRLLRERERDLERFRVGVKLRRQWS